MDNIYPVANATAPYWRSELHEIDSYRSTEKLPEECDIVIFVLTRVCETTQSQDIAYIL
jgi:hypothetical protein